MYFIDELNDLKVYGREFLLPINDTDKKKKSAVFLLTPNKESTIETMRYKFLKNKYFNSFYTEYAATYYINESTKEYEQSQEILNEHIDKILNKDGLHVDYIGYDYDTSEVMSVLTADYIKNTAAEYGVEIPNNITINVVRTTAGPSTKDTINVSSRKNYNNRLKNYNAYLKYCAMEMILHNLKNKIEVPVIYGTCLYESDLYEIHKSKWIFDQRLKGICSAIDIYIKSKGKSTYGKKVLGGGGLTALSKKSLSKMIAKDLEAPGTMLLNLMDSVTESADSVGTFHMVNDMIDISNECRLVIPLTEDASYNSNLKRILYPNRFKNLKEIKNYYAFIKESDARIKYTYTDISKYKGLNLFVDLSYYNNVYFSNCSFKRERGLNTYFELMSRLLRDKRLNDNGYNKKTVLIPVYHWFKNDDKNWMYTIDINPISTLYSIMKKNPTKLNELFKGYTFVFLGHNAYFKLNLDNQLEPAVISKFIQNIKRISSADCIPDETDSTAIVKNSPKVIKTDIIDKIETSQGVEINNISDKKTDNTEEKKDSTKTEKENDKAELVEKISKATETGSSEEEVLDSLDKDDRLKEILADLSSDADKKSNISAARAARIVKIDDDLMTKQFKDRSLKDILNAEPVLDSLPEVSLNVNTINDDWQHMTWMSANEVYDMDADIIRMFHSFNKMTHPLSVIDITAEDNSTSEDVVDLYTVKYENENGKRFTIKVDIPKMIDNKYMKLRGNRKEIPCQLFLMPIIKTDNDTVQLVSNYNKIFIRRNGSTAGKSNVICDKLIKTINKNEFKSLKIVEGDNSRICIGYELPIDYVDLASIYNQLETPSTIYYFNQDEIRNKYKDKIDESKGIPVGYRKKTREIIYYNGKLGNQSTTFAYQLKLDLESDDDLNKEDFGSLFNKATASTRYAYSQASVLDCKIPVVVVCGLSEGLVTTLNKANIKYHLEESKRGINPIEEDAIKFNDGYLIYKLDYASSMLMNGLKVCNTEDYSLSEINNRGMYLDFLDLFGGRIKADGLDNFYNMFVDVPITYETLEYYKLPTDYIEILLYANRLLVDNKFSKHTDITGNRRIRRNEQIPAILYIVLSKAYGSYCTQMNHGRAMPMTIKQSAVIDKILENSTTSDLSIINALCEYEAYNAVTPKGPSGMNSDRSFTLDKRAFDSSMYNVMGMSTGFAGTVGVTRQVTVDANVSTSRGYIVNKDDPNELSATKSLCMTESLTPFGSTRDDPFRTAMTFIQTSKHGMRCKRTNPSLITTGADEALPYMISNIFAYKAKEDGEVTDVNEERIIVTYKDGTSDYIDLTEHVEKNSSSGFYITLKLDTDLKVGKKIKKGDVLAYDKNSFSSDIGEDDNPAYNIGTIAKIAVLNTEEGYEDSTIISEDLSEDLSSDIVVCKDITLPKNTSIYNLVRKGQPIEEGDTLMIIQNDYDDEDANMLLRNLAADEEEITNLGRVPIKSKVTGVVQDIVITRTVDLDELSPTLKKVVGDYEKDLNRRKKEMNKYGISNADAVIGSTDKLPATGKLKKASDGVLIEIYLKYNDKMSVGDKIVAYSALKGVTRDIFPKGKEPTSEYRPNEKIHVYLAVGSINRRMVGSIISNILIYKILIELTRQCKDILDIPYSDNLFEK